MEARALGGRAQPHPREQPSLLGRIPTKTAAKRPERLTRAPVWLRRVRALPVLSACLAQERMVRTVRLSAEVRSSESPAPAKTKPFGCSTKKSTTTSGNSFTIRPRIRAAFSALRTSHRRRSRRPDGHSRCNPRSRRSRRTGHTRRLPRTTWHRPPQPGQPPQPGPQTPQMPTRPINGVNLNLVLKCFVGWAGPAYCTNSGAEF